MIRFSIAFTLLCITASSTFAETIMLRRAPSAVNNPLKGLVPYSRPTPGRFEHSMEFSYLGLAEVMTGEDQYDWAPLESMLDDIASRGNQTVFRIFLEYPNKANVIPQFLIDKGLAVHKYVNTNTAPLPPSPVETPDYENADLRRALKNFVAALGRRYDGDPRIAYITAGLLGTWGEWHTYPRNELFASKEVQAEVMDAYEAAFKSTPVLLRYPAGDDTWGKSPNAKRAMGYHDDSFAWATLDTGKPADSWYYMPALESAGEDAVNKWKTQPIGGEIRPEAWGKVFDQDPGDAKIQDFETCVQQTHATWLMDTGMFRESPSAERRERAEQQVRKMGYDFHISRFDASLADNNRLAFELQWSNDGVAPFYRDWEPRLAIIAGGKVVSEQELDVDLRSIMPETESQQVTGTWELAELPADSWTVAISIPNPMPGGKPVRFANETQDAELPGWLSLARFDVTNRAFVEVESK